MNTENIKKGFRPAAVPLITVDPYFSIWSGSDNLYSTPTKHWTDKPMPMVTGIRRKGIVYNVASSMKDMTPTTVRIPQTNLKITPLSTEYTFENNFVKLTITYTTPLLMDRLDILTRPVSYIAYKIEKKSEQDDLDFIFGINSRCCVNDSGQNVVFKKNKYSVSCGNSVQKPLSTADDCVAIDWGYLHLCDKDAYVAVYEKKDQQIVRSDMDKEYNVYQEMPYIMTETKALSGVYTVAYDEVTPIEYFGKPLSEYYTKFFDSFDDMLKAAMDEYDEIKRLCDEFDAKLMSEAEKYGENYRNILSLAYRQAIAAHKLVEDEDGNILFLSKECNSNGCIGTLDVTYPSIPLFLKYNPELVCGMLRPIIRFAKSDVWKFDFAPHDVGTYPIANGQVYGMESENGQMPVEESGNILICLAAIWKYGGGKKLFDDNKNLMKKWADYLVENGYDPGTQLCTDDFAGHLNHNCNLSLKAILGIASYSLLSGDGEYMNIAKEFAKRWEKDARASHGATRLTFDNPDGWSLKYNMVWDEIFGLNIFSEETRKKEIELYKTKLNRYGVPLDSREDYTKLDWLIWSTRLYGDMEYMDAALQSVVDMICETQDRVPLTDWYYTTNGMYQTFRNRSVVGGVFINLLD